MTGRFPAPWRIVEIPSGFAVEDTTGLQLGVLVEPIQTLQDTPAS